MVVESQRILRDGGALLLTTPNCASISSLARVLRGDHPGVFTQFPRPERGEPRGVHAREYMPGELSRAWGCAGFEVEWMLTERFDEVAGETWALDLIEQAGMDTRLRGEQIYCMARRREDAPIECYPAFLYTG